MDLAEWALDVDRKRVAVDLRSPKFLEVSNVWRRVMLFVILFSFLEGFGLFHSLKDSMIRAFRSNIFVSANFSP